MRVLVTGGAGFIGSHIAQRLTEQQHDVIVLDNESTGLRENVPPMASYIKGDVAETADLHDAFSSGVEAVCHIAGQVSLIRSYSDAANDLRTNVLGTLNVIRQCMRHRVPRLLYAGSMAAYGQAAVLPTPEDARCEPVSYYGITKYAAERYVRTSAERPDLDFELNVTCFRMYNVYGPRQSVDNPYQGVLGIFIGNVLRQEPITIYGDGTQSRDFVYIDDVVDAWMTALANPASYGMVFNLGSGRETTINDLARNVAAVVAARSDYPIVYRPARPGEIRSVRADIRLARDVMGWEPRVPFERGLALTAQSAARSFKGING